MSPLARAKPWSTPTRAVASSQARSAGDAPETEAKYRYEHSPTVKLPWLAVPNAPDQSTIYRGDLRGVVPLGPTASSTCRTTESSEERE